MRCARFIELAAWSLGLGLLGLYAGARWWSETARAQGVDAFEAQQRELALTSFTIDRSLWSSARERAYEESAGSAGMPSGVLRMPALGMAVPIYEGVTELNLNRGAARIDGTAGLGPRGNIGLAAHRDSFFRSLKDVSIDDEITLEVADRTLRYRVVDLRIVMPEDVHVLAGTSVPSITLVTCFPFYYVGAAPQRYIVRAELTGSVPSATLSRGFPGTG